MTTKKEKEQACRDEAIKFSFTGSFVDSLMIEHAMDRNFRDIARAWPNWFRQELDEYCRLARGNGGKSHSVDPKK